MGAVQVIGPEPSALEGGPSMSRRCALAAMVARTRKAFAWAKNAEFRTRQRNVAIAIVTALQR